VEAYCESLAAYWHPVIAEAAVGDRPAAVELLGRRLAVARVEGRLVIFDDLCRHLGAALSQGAITDEGRLRCAYHGWTYDSEGRCVDIPARRGLPIPREARVRTYPTVARYGLVWVCLAAEPPAGIPEFPEYDDAEFRVAPLREYRGWAASAPRIVMGALDDTHFAWVHPGLLGDPAHPEPPDHQAWVEDGRMVSTYRILQPANSSIGGDAGGSNQLEEVAYTNYATPTTIRLIKAAPAGQYVIWMGVCPQDHDRSIVFLQVARSFDRDPARDEQYLQFEDRIQAQDRTIIEGQRPWLLPPLSSRLMLYVRPADLPLIVFQRWLEELGVPQL
jgi:vanillate O-demethylase monooxygenase subunit